MREKALFGPAGNCEDFYEKGYKSTVQAPGYLDDMGLYAYEYSCGRGVLLKQDTAERIAEQAAEHGITMSIHAPYFTNLCNPDPEKQEATRNWLLQSAQAVLWLGGNRVIFHPGALMKQTREKAREVAENNMKAAVDAVLSKFPDIILCPETLGKKNQYGNLSEVLSLCKPYDPHVLPCIDFAHLHAAGCGCINGEGDFDAIIKEGIDTLGLERMREFHSHFSHIEYTSAGEKRHKKFSDEGYGPDFGMLAPILVKYGLFPTVICESAGSQSTDAAAMQKIYEETV